MTRANAGWRLMACIALWGCDLTVPSDAPANPRGLPPAEPTANARRTVERTDSDPAAEPVGPAPTATAEPGEAEREPQEEEAPRDLGAELHAAFGAPATCLKPRVAGPDAPSTIQLTLEANVLENGMLTRTSASSAQLDEDELRCVRQRLAGLRLAEPVEDAPHSIRTTIEVPLKAPEKSGT